MVDFVKFTPINLVENSMKLDVELRSEAIRLTTFHDCPLHYFSPKVLAAAGFYYCGSADETRCASCCITISQWGQMDIPDKMHQRFAPNCPFVLGLPVNNVSISHFNKNLFLALPGKGNVLFITALICRCIHTCDAFKISSDQKVIFIGYYSTNKAL